MLQYTMSRINYPKIPVIILLGPNLKINNRFPRVISVADSYVSKLDNLNT